jgi:hypothetical protein
MKQKQSRVRPSRSPKKKGQAFERGPDFEDSQRSPIWAFGHLLLLSVIVGWSSRPLELLLHPVYGSTAAGLYYWRIAFVLGMVTWTLVASAPVRWRRFIPPSSVALAFISFVLATAPVSSRLLFRLSGRLGPRVGPVVTQLPLYWTVVAFASLLGARAMVHTCFSFTQTCHLADIAT